MLVRVADVDVGEQVRWIERRMWPVLRGSVNARTGVVMVGAALAAVPLFGPVGSAWANPRGDCPLGKICLYSGRGFTGEKEQFEADPRGGNGLQESQFSSCTVVSQPIWSAVNRSGPRAATSSYRVHIYSTADCRHEVATLGPNAAREDTKGSPSFDLECVDHGGCGQRGPWRPTGGRDG